MQTQEIEKLINFYGENYISLLERIGVLYIRPRIGLEPNGPLVGRQSTYPDPNNPGILYRYVSENYYNGEVLYNQPLVCEHLAKGIWQEMRKKYAPKPLIFRGVGRTGEVLAKYLNNLQENYKETNQVALVQGILDPIKLEKAIWEVKNEGKKIGCFCCVINPDHGYDGYLPINSQGPVILITLIKQLLKKFEQNHPYVADDVAKGNVIWDPKKNWHKLIEIIAINNDHKMARNMP